MDLRVHAAVALVTDAHTAADETTVKLVIERLANAGHQLLECSVIQDSEPLVRAQLQTWIANPEIDVIIAIAGIETGSTRPALAPLITKPLDGFAELFRMISYEEIGTGAMLVDVTAAECKTTFVFLLPASNGAVRSALDKLIIPQLDHRTKPRNLVSKMPRLRSWLRPHGVAPGVPITITDEKTEIAFVPPPAAGQRPPAAIESVPDARTSDSMLRTMPGPVIIRPKTASERPASASEASPAAAVTPARRNRPLTSPGEIALAALWANSTVTEHTPPTEPAAPSTPPVGRTPTPITARASRAQTSAGFPAMTRAPAASTSIGIAKPNGPSVTTSSGAAVPSAPKTVPPPAPKAPTPAIGMNALPRVIRVPTPPPSSNAASAAAAVAAAAAMTTTASASVAAPAAMTTTASASVAAPAAMTTTASASPPPAPTPPRTATSSSSPPPAPKPATPAVGVKPTTTPPPLPPKGRANTPLPRRFDDKVLAPLPPGATPIEDVPLLDVEPELEEIETPSNGAATPVEAAAPADTATPVEAAAPAIDIAAMIDRATAPTPIAEATPSDPEPLVAAVAVPTLEPRPKVEDTNGAVVTEVTRGESTDKIRGEKRARSKLPYAIFAAALVAAGVFVVVQMTRESEPTRALASSDPTSTRPPPPPDPVVEPPAIIIDAAEAEVATPDAAEVPTETEPPATEPPATEPPATEPPVTAAGDPKPTEPAAKRPKRRPTRATPRTAEATPKTPKAEKPKQPTPTAGGCDEVSCVMDKYARACCAKYKPSEPSFKPNLGGTPETLDKTLIKIGTSKVSGAIAECGAKSGVKGTVKIAVKVAPDGHVIGAATLSSPDPALGACVANAIRRASYATTVKGGSFTYPFEF